MREGALDAITCDSLVLECKSGEMVFTAETLRPAVGPRGSVEEIRSGFADAQKTAEELADSARGFVSSDAGPRRGASGARAASKACIATSD